MRTRCHPVSVFITRASFEGETLNYVRYLILKRARCISGAAIILSEAAVLKWARRSGDNKSRHAFSVLVVPQTRYLMACVYKNYVMPAAL